MARLAHSQRAQLAYGAAISEPISCIADKDTGAIDGKICVPGWYYDLMRWGTR